LIFCGAQIINQSDQKKKSKAENVLAGCGEPERQDLKIEEAAASAGIFPIGT
jgi:hypothetical protein